MRGYQLDYASKKPILYEKSGRERKALRLVKTVRQHYKPGRDVKDLSVLDIGSSTGLISNTLAKHFKKVIGVDIDKEAVEFSKKKFKRKNLNFRLGDAMKLGFKKNSFDVVTCLHVYEHVPSDKRLFSEIHRVLKPGGVCYFAAGNRLWPWEYHYDLPFLTWLPKKIANIYIGVRGEREYYESLKTYWGLKKLTKKFARYEYTQRILRNPKVFGYDDSMPKNSFRSLVAFVFSPISKYTAPTFFWILEKK